MAAARDSSAVTLHAQPRHHHPARDRLLVGQIGSELVVAPAKLVGGGEAGQIGAIAFKPVGFAYRRAVPGAADGEDLAFPHRVLPIDLGGRVGESLQSLGEKARRVAEARMVCFALTTILPELKARAQSL